MKKKYFVLSEGNTTYEGFKQFENCKYFGGLLEAREYALEHLPARVAEISPLTDEKNLMDKEQPFLVVGQRSFGLYSMGEFDGYGHSYVSLRSSEGDLEQNIDTISGLKEIKKTFAGLELKLV